MKKCTAPALSPQKNADWSYAAPRQGTPRIVSSHQKLGQRCGTDSSSEPPEGTNPAGPLILYFWSPEMLLM